MRVIDADALKKQIEDFHCKGCDNYNFVRCRACWVDDTLSYLDEAPTVGGWISVKDRLPNVAGWYLVFYNGSKMQVAFFKGKKWPFDNHYHKVTHWMPLPEPPKDGT